LIYFYELLYAEPLRRDNRSPEVRFRWAKGLSALADTQDRNHKLWIRSPHREPIRIPDFGLSAPQVFRKLFIPNHRP
jgi:hypothetical protein